MGSRLIILASAILLTACDENFEPPPSWTLRADGHLRASQRKEDFTLEQAFAMLKRSEQKDYFLVVTPAGEAKISREIRKLQAALLECKQAQGVENAQP